MTAQTQLLWPRLVNCGEGNRSKGPLRPPGRGLYLVSPYPVFVSQPSTSRRNGSANPAKHLFHCS